VQLTAYLSTLTKSASVLNDVGHIHDCTNHFISPLHIRVQLVDRHLVLTANREDRGPSGPRRRPGGRGGMVGLGAMLGYSDRW
jgi:COP9 signalosome complex subunit 6